MANKRKVYPVEFRRQMVELVWSGRKPGELSREFGPTDWTIRKWVRQAERDAKRCDGGQTTSEREELGRLPRECRQLKKEFAWTVCGFEGASTN